MANEVTIPALPCRDLDESISFYQALGFVRTYRQERPNPYAVVSRDDFHIHLFTIDGFDPEQSYATVIVVVPDADELYEAFAAGLWAAYGKLPSAGIPRILRPRKREGTVRGLSVVDPGGNWLRISKHGDTEDVEAEDRTSGLARVIDNAARQGDARGDHEFARRLLDNGLVWPSSGMLRCLTEPGRCFTGRNWQCVEVIGRQLRVPCPKRCRSSSATRREPRSPESWPTPPKSCRAWTDSGRTKSVGRLTRRAGDRRPNHLALLVDLVRGLHAQRSRHPLRSNVTGVDVSAEALDALCSEPVAHRRGRLRGEALALPLDTDNPGDIRGITRDSCLHVTDRHAGVVGSDNPVVPDLLARRGTGNLGRVVGFEIDEAGGASPYKAVEVTVGENPDHLGGIDGPKG